MRRQPVDGVRWAGQALNTVDFDAQASQFRRRAGISPELAAAVAQYIAGLRDGVRVIDLGAGTGELVFALGNLARRCVALDASRAMIEELRARLPAESRVETAVADANGAWPLADRSLDVALASRSLHWLDPNHVARELARVLDELGGWLLAGRCHRPQGHPVRDLKHILHTELRRRGHQPGNNDNTLRRCVNPLQEHFEVETLAPHQWPLTPDSVQSQLDDWRSKPGLAGVTLSTEAQIDVLDRVEAQARGRFDKQQMTLEHRRSYALEGLRLKRKSARQWVKVSC